MDLLGTWGKRTQDLLGGARRSLLGDDLPPEEKRAATVGTFGPSVLEQTGTMLAAQEKALKRGGIRDMLHDPDAYQAAKQVAGNLDFTGTFGGVFAKGADLGAHNMARRMKGEGKPAEEIWQQTGWFQGPDKKWRFEIDDSKAQLDRPERLDLLASGESIPAGEIFKHSDLYAAYPELSTTKMDRNVPVSAGGVSRGGAIGIREGMTPAQQRDLSLHEMQHEIQNKEGFAKGGSPEEFKPILEEYNRVANMFQGAARVRYRMETYGESLEDAAGNVSMIHKQDQKTLENLVKAYPGKKLDTAYNKALAKAQNYNPRGEYRRLAGEAEARAVEQRRSLTPEERRAIFPSYDVPPEQQIVRGVR